jgi:hypothetical protein
MRQTAVAHIEEASVTKTRTRERKPAEHVTDRIGVVRDERACYCGVREAHTPSR